MAVLCEAISIVVPVAALQEHYPGGLGAYAKASPNRTFCADGSVARIGFLAPDDARQWLDMLAGHGLPAEGADPQVAVVDQAKGLLAPSTWLSTISDGSTRIAWRTGEDPQQTFVPDGWSRQAHAALTRLTPEDIDGLSMVADGPVRTYRDPATGRTLQQGRIIPREEDSSDPADESGA